MHSLSHTVRRSQLSAHPDEQIDIDSLLTRLENGGHNKQESLRLMKRYLELELNLPITDAPMRRLCELMTINGCATTESCEGHGNNLPLVFFKLDELDKVANLSYILRKASSGKNYIWEVGVDAKYSSAPSLFPIDFTLRAVARNNETIDASAHRELLMFDLHYIGIAILSFYSKKK